MGLPRHLMKDDEGKWAYQEWLARQEKESSPPPPPIDDDDGEAAQDGGRKPVVEE